MQFQNIIGIKKTHLMKYLASVLGYLITGSTSVSIVIGFLGYGVSMVDSLLRYNAR